MARRVDPVDNRSTQVGSSFDEKVVHPVGQRHPLIVG